MRLKVRNASNGRLVVKAQKLVSSAPYEVLVDGVLVGRFTTTAKGIGRIRFRSRPRSAKDVLLGFDPRGALLVVRDDSGRDVLAVALADNGSRSTDLLHPATTAARVRGPDAGRVHGARGDGVDRDVVSTEPVCGGSPPAGGDVICCVPDDSGPECEDRTRTTVRCRAASWSGRRRASRTPVGRP